MADPWDIVPATVDQSGPSTSRKELPKRTPEKRDPWDLPTTSVAPEARVSEPEQPPAQTLPAEGALQTFARSAVPKVIPGLLGLAGSVVGGAAGALGGPAAPVTVPAGAIAGGIAAESQGEKVNKWVASKLFAPEHVQAFNQQLEADKLAHPLAATSGEMFGGIGSMFAGGGVAKGAKVASKIGGALLESAVSGAVMTGGSEAQNPDATVYSTVKAAVQGGATMAPLAFVPHAKSILGAVGWRAPTDAAILATSNALYDHFVNGKEINPEELKQQIGKDIPSFMLMNGIMGVMGRMPLLPSATKNLHDAKTPDEVINNPADVHTVLAQAGAMPAEPIAPAPTPEDLKTGAVAAKLLADAFPVGTAAFEEQKKQDKDAAALRRKPTRRTQQAQEPSVAKPSAVVPPIPEESPADAVPESVKPLSTQTAPPPAAAKDITPVSPTGKPAAGVSIIGPVVVDADGNRWTDPGEGKPATHDNIIAEANRQGAGIPFDNEKFRKFDTTGGKIVDRKQGAEIEQANGGKVSKSGELHSEDLIRNRKSVKPLVSRELTAQGDESAIQEKSNADEIEGAEGIPLGERTEDGSGVRERNAQGKEDPGARAKASAEAKPVAVHEAPTPAAKEPVRKPVKSRKAAAPAEPIPTVEGLKYAGSKTLPDGRTAHSWTDEQTGKTFDTVGKLDAAKVAQVRDMARAEWEKRTGEKLPKGVGDTNKAVTEYFGNNGEPVSEQTKPVPDPAPARRPIPKRTQAEAVKATPGTAKYKLGDAGTNKPTEALHADQSERTTRVLRDLSEEIGRNLESKVTMAPVSRDSLGIDAAGLHVLSSLERMFGKEIIFADIKDDAGKTANMLGYNSPTHPDSLVIRRDASQPHLQIIGHELFHSIKRDAPDLYREFKRAMLGEYKDHSEFADLLNRIRRQSGMPEMSFPEIREELNSDMLGNQMLHPEFWDLLQKKQPGVFRKIADYAAKWLGILKNTIADYVDSSVADKYFKDVDAARGHLAGMLAKYAGRKEIRKRTEAPQRVTLSDETPRGTAMYAKGEPTNEVKTPLPESRKESDIQSVRRLSEALSRQEGRSISIKSVSEDSVPRPPAEVLLLRKLGQMFGRDVVFFSDESAEPFRANGITEDNEVGTIFINARGDHPLPFVFGHELVHDVKRQDSALYREMESKILPLIQKFDDWKQIIGRSFKSYEKLDDDKAREELLSHAMEYAMRQPKFWHELKSQDASLFSKLARTVVEWIGKTHERIKSFYSKQADVSMFFTDTEAVRKELLGMIVESGRREIRKRSETPGETPRGTATYELPTKLTRGDYDERDIRDQINRQNPPSDWKGDDGNRRGRELAAIRGLQQELGDGAHAAQVASVVHSDVFSRSRRFGTLAEIASRNGVEAVPVEGDNGQLPFNVGGRVFLPDTKEHGNAAIHEIGHVLDRKGIPEIRAFISAVNRGSEYFTGTYSAVQNHPFFGPAYRENARKELGLDPNKELSEKEQMMVDDHVGNTVAADIALNNLTGKNTWDAISPKDIGLRGEALKRVLDGETPRGAAMYAQSKPTQQGRFTREQVNALPETKDESERLSLQRVSEAIKKEHGLDLKGTVIDKSAYPFEAGESDALHSLEQVFGKRVVFFRTQEGSSFDPDGIRSGVSKDQIFINVNADRPILNTMGHELMHEMEADDPKLYAGLIESISANSRQFPIWKAEYEDLFGRSVSDKKAISELVAELSGNSILDRKMLDALKTVNPSLFSRVSEYIKNWISKTTQDIQKTIGGRKDVAQRFFKDADAAKQAVTESMSEYGQRRQLRRMTDIRPEPDYTVAALRGAGRKLGLDLNMSDAELRTLANDILDAKGVQMDREIVEKRGMQAARGERQEPDTGERDRIATRALTAVRGSPGEYKSLMSWTKANYADLYDPTLSEHENAANVLVGLADAGERPENLRGPASVAFQRFKTAISKPTRYALPGEQEDTEAKPLPPRFQQGDYNAGHIRDFLESGIHARSDWENDIPRRTRAGREAIERGESEVNRPGDETTPALRLAQDDAFGRTRRFAQLAQVAEDRGLTLVPVRELPNRVAAMIQGKDVFITSSRGNSHLFIHEIGHAMEERNEPEFLELLESGNSESTEFLKYKAMSEKDQFRTNYFFNIASKRLSLSFEQARLPENRASMEKEKIRAMMAEKASDYLAGIDDGVFGAPSKPLRAAALKRILEGLKPESLTGTPRKREMDARIAEAQASEGTESARSEVPAAAPNVEGTTWRDIRRKPDAAFSVKEEPAYKSEKEFLDDYRENGEHAADETPEEFLKRRFCGGVV